jgi:hypothetical protein
MKKVVLLTLVLIAAVVLASGCKKKSGNSAYVPPEGNHHPRVSRLYLNDDTYFYPDSARHPSSEKPEYYMFTGETLSIGWQIEDEDGDPTDGWVTFYDWSGPVDGSLGDGSDPPFEIAVYCAPISIPSAPWGVYLILYVTDDQGGGDSVGIQIYVYNW